VPTKPLPRASVDLERSTDTRQFEVLFSLFRNLGARPMSRLAQNRIVNLEADGATDFRVNQQQVDINGTRVGVNRPDLRYTLEGQRVYEEFDIPGSTRGLSHEVRIRANDPNAVVNLFTVR